MGLKIRASGCPACANLLTAWEHAVRTYTDFGLKGRRELEMIFGCLKLTSCEWIAALPAMLSWRIGASSIATSRRKQVLHNATFRHGRKRISSAAPAAAVIPITESNGKYRDATA